METQTIQVWVNMPDHPVGELKIHFEAPAFFTDDQVYDNVWNLMELFDMDRDQLIAWSKVDKHA